MVAQSTLFPISCSSICLSVFCHSDSSPLAAASCLNPCSMVAQHKRFLTLVSCFRPFACLQPSQPSYALHPHHVPPILRSHDTRGSRHRFQRSSLRFSAALLTFLPLPPTSLLAVINAFLFHVTSGSLHRFQPSFRIVPLHFCSSTTISAFIHANVHLARPKLSRRQNASPSSPYHALQVCYQYPTPHP
jgi:hypothetical protein